MPTHLFEFWLFRVMMYAFWALIALEFTMRIIGNLVEAYYKMRLRIAKAPAKAEEELVAE